jgi:drug/metabolite transporter (DMT)-like permease
MDTRKPLDAAAVAAMASLCLIWALQQIVLKATAAEIAPLMQIALRSGIAAALVWLLMLARRERLSLADGNWRAGLAVGLLFALEFLLLGEAVRRTSASHLVVFLYTAPIFAALGLHWRLPEERLRPAQWLGIVLAFTGIALTFFNRAGASAASASGMLWGDALAVLAGLAWGATTVLVRCTRLSKAPATQTLLYQLAAAFVLLLAAAIMLGQTTFRATPLAWGVLAFQSLIISFASYLAWFGLLRRYLASQLGTFSFMTPLSGIVLGAWLLGETIEPAFLGGAALVLAGILLVSGHAWLGRRIRVLMARPRA